MRAQSCAHSLTCVFFRVRVHRGGSRSVTQSSVSQLIFPTANAVVDRTAFRANKATPKVTLLLTGGQLTDGHDHNAQYMAYQPSVESVV